MSPAPQPYKRKDGTVGWAVRFRLTPGANPVRETFEDPHAAQEFVRVGQTVGWAAAREARDAAAGSRTAVRTLARALDEHLDQLAASVTPGTIAGYRSMAARTWLPAMGHLPPSAITRETVNRWIAAQRETPARGGGTYSRKSIRNAQGLLSAVLQREVEAGRLDRNPAKGVKLPGNTARKKEPVYLTPNQFTAIHAQVRPEYQTLIALLYGTGLRWGEATALKAQDFDLDAARPTLRVARAWKTDAGGKVVLGTPKTSRARRTVTLPASIVPELRDRLEGLAPDDLVFPAARGGPIRTAYFHTWVWGPACKASGTGLRPRLHDLRHSHASWLIQNGVTLPVVQRRLGHESIQTTVDTYGHLAPDAHAGAADAADLALVQAVPQIEA